MFKGIFTPGTVAGSTNLPISASKNTNNRIGFNNNAILLKSVGLYDVSANIVVEGTVAGVLTAQLYADGVAIPGALASMTVAIGSTYTLNISDIIATVIGDTGYVNVTVQLSGGASVVGGEINVSYRG